MSEYNPEKDMPVTVAEWNELVAFKVAEAKTAYDAAVAEAKANAQAVYATLPDSEKELTLEQYVAQAAMNVPLPISAEGFKRLYACYYPRPEAEEPVQTVEELFAQLRSIREMKLREYDQKISQLDRLIRLNPDYAAYQLERGEWDSYAVALCNLPAQEGAPWDGGLSQTPWPARPA